MDTVSKKEISHMIDKMIILNNNFDIVYHRYIQIKDGDINKKLNDVISLRQKIEELSKQ